MSRSESNKKYWQSPAGLLEKEKRRIQFTQNNPSRLPKVQEKQRQGQLRAWKTEARHKKRNAYNQTDAGKRRNAQFGEQAKTRLTEPMHNSKIRAKLVKALNTPECRAKKRKNTLALWKDPEYAKKVCGAKYICPNKAELNLLSYLPVGWEFVGDGKLVISGKMPDFVNRENKQVIEMFGDYWHSEKFTHQSCEVHEAQRIQLFKDNGWKTLIIWERELSDPTSLVEKLHSFLKV